MTGIVRRSGSGHVLAHVTIRIPNLFRVCFHVKD